MGLFKRPEDIRKGIALTLFEPNSGQRSPNFGYLDINWLMTMKNLSVAWVLSLWLGIGFTGCANAATTTKSQVFHVLNRLSLGIAPGDISRVESRGIESYIQEQLSPENIPEPKTLTQQLAKIPTLKMTPAQLAYNYGPPVARGEKPTREIIKAYQQQGQTILQQARQARFLRASISMRQLEEVMVDFWFNHFNVSSSKGIVRLWVGSYEETAIRPYVLGRFRDLLEATARHPAMLFYLDNWQNTAPSSPGARGRLTGLNENYARELMELHTLGVDGGYSQEDVTVLARIFTGWGFRGGKQGNPDFYSFHFHRQRHDFSHKIFLGQKIKGSGEAEVEQALDILAKSPATARHLSYKLAQYFVADSPPPALVQRLSRRYLASDGNIKAVLETLFKSPEFWLPENLGNKFKTPYQYVISVLRTSNQTGDNERSLSSTLQQLAMPLYGCPTPDGYKNTRASWLNPDAMTRRLSFVTTFARQFSLDPAQLRHSLGNNFSPQTKTVVANNPPQLRAALILGSPEFMYR